ncbi:MAG TPA: ABC transporter permease [Clostridia bacterium]|nr:ABC transporter permease [Clostridia bacterium]
MKKESIFLSKGFVNATASVIAILVGIVFGFVILLISNPSEAIAGLGYIFRGGFSGGAKGMGQVLYFSTPIILTGLSVGFAFKTGLFNIGAPGQFLTGAFVAILVGVKWTFLPAPFHWIVAVICGTLAGGVWALVPGFFKAYLNVNEVISCIMFNYIGLYGVNFLVKKNIYDSLKALSQNVATTAVLPKAGLDNIFFNTVGNTKDISTLNGGFYIAIAAAVVIYIVLNKTTFGYELKACGYNRFASRYAGINEKRSIVLSMFISGMLSGMGGALLYLSGASGRRIKVVDVLAAEGFSGIPVALLGLSNPIGIVFAGLFISYITIGGDYMQRLDFVPEIIDIIIAVIIYFSAFSLLFRNVIIKILTGKSDKELAAPVAVVDDSAASEEK